MTIVTIHEAKTHLSRLIKAVLAGEEITIARGKLPVARLMPIEEAKPKIRKLGRLSHQIPQNQDPLDNGFWDTIEDEFLGYDDARESAK